MIIKWITITFLVACNVAKQPVKAPRPRPINYVIKMVTKGNEPGTKNYKIQQSYNNRNWTTLTTVTPNYLPDSNVYNFTLPTPKTSRYYRIISVMVKGSYTSDAIYIKVP